MDNKIKTLDEIKEEIDNDNKVKYETLLNEAINNVNTDIKEALKLNCHSCILRCYNSDVRPIIEGILKEQGYNLYNLDIFTVDFDYKKYFKTFFDVILLDTSVTTDTSICIHRNLDIWSEEDTEILNSILLQCRIYRK